MSAVKQVRLAYGLTQLQLADYLGVSHGLLSMAEHGKRELPTTALLLLNRLYPQPEAQFTGRLAQKRQAVLQKQSTAFAKALQNQITDANLGREVAKRQLTVLEGRFAQANSALQLVARLRQTPGGGGNEPLWLDVLEADALKQMERCGEKAQVLLQLRITGLAQQVQLMQDCLDKLQTGV